MNDIQRFEVIFTKMGLMKYISHLDLMRLFQRALRRTALPFVLSKGFSPHPRISFKRALRLGVESQDERVIFNLAGTVEMDEFKLRLQKQLPAGITLVEVIKV